ncbi:myeloid-associated differentiation marker-like [Sminthopsis crassicaudata]|uniref:myeloid-associated differentiation marker-like n=1 Tax=Sminthopsis crassicaudata TaxID=9301 RepID=UPI003D6869AD
MPRPTLVPRALVSLGGLLRLLQVILSCAAFGLAASGHRPDAPFGAWCLCSWGLCGLLSLAVLGLELLGLGPQLPLSWEDFTATVALLGTLLTFTASIMYPSVFVPRGLEGWRYQATATATALSCLCFVTYTAEVGLTRARPGQLRGFLSTTPGLLKVLEAFVASVILALVDVGHMYANSAGLQWCMAVFCVCFVVSVLVIGLSVGRLLDAAPWPADRALLALTGLAALLYLSAAVTWPIFAFAPAPPKDQFGPAVGATVLTWVNLGAYAADLVVSSRMVFFAGPP